MPDRIEQILFSAQPKRFADLESETRQFSLIYGGESIVRENIFSVILNYARKKELPLEIMRYPFHDDELWAFTFLKGEAIFLCVNSGLPMCRQIFAAAHELYHIYCFGEDTDQNTIRNGSLLKETAIDEGACSREELEANAFAGLLLMPGEDIQRQINTMGIDLKHLDLDDVLSLMDVFALPYKACVLRLYECGILRPAKARELYNLDMSTVNSRIRLTGKAKRWQLDGSGTEQFGTLLEDFSFNKDHGFLTESREKSDTAYISALSQRYGLDLE